MFFSIKLKISTSQKCTNTSLKWFVLLSVLFLPINSKSILWNQCNQLHQNLNGIHHINSKQQQTAALKKHPKTSKHYITFIFVISFFVAYKFIDKCRLYHLIYEWICWWRSQVSSADYKNDTHSIQNSYSHTFWMCFNLIFFFVWNGKSYNLNLSKQIPFIVRSHFSTIIGMILSLDNHYVITHLWT